MVKIDQHDLPTKQAVPNQLDIPVADRASMVKDRTTRLITMDKDPDLEPGLDPKLLPYKDQMKDWVEKNRPYFAFFLNHKTPFKIKYGQGFAYRSKDNAIIMSVPFFKGHLDNQEYTIDQIMFAIFHEFAHLKTAVEEDAAGVKNMLAHYNYEAAKRIADKDAPDDPARIVVISQSYRQFYNILEDAIVNHLVFMTGFYGQETGESGRQRRQEIVNLYTDKFFAIYRSVPAGTGDYQEEEKEIRFVGKNKGNLQVLKKEDYTKPIDWTQLYPQQKRCEQFLTFFMKNQMLGLKVDEQQHFHEDVESVFKKPLVKTYEILLTKIIDKYAGDPQQWGRYFKFMTETIPTTTFSFQGQTLLKQGELIPNVVGQPTGVPTVDNDQRTINIRLATNLFMQKVINLGETLGIKYPQSATFLQIFETFKKINLEKKGGMTIPLKYKLAERTRVMRLILEPIFSMLCILDDSFDVTLPQEKPSSSSSPKNKKTPTESDNEENENPEVRDWEVGDPVVYVDRDGSRRKGVIAKVHHEVVKNSQPEVTSVDVQFYTNSDDSTVMSADAQPKQVYGQRKYEIGTTNFVAPFEGLYVDNDDEEGEEGGEDQEDRRHQENKENEQKQKQNKKSKKTPSPEQQDKNTESGLDVMRQTLEQLDKDNDRAANARELEKLERSSDHQRDISQAKMDEAIKKALEQKRKLDNEPKPSDPKLSDENMIAKFHELEEKLHQHINQMDWSPLIKRVISQISRFEKDKYYRSGKLDSKRVQKHFPEIQFGADVSIKLIYEQIIEIIKTDIRPRLFRATILADNSGSMDDKRDMVYVCIMLLNSSLRAFRVALNKDLHELLGHQLGEDSIPEFAVDTQMRLFDYGDTLAKQYDIKNFDFLFDNKLTTPHLSPHAETVGTIAAFQRLTTDGSTYDEPSWKNILAEHLASPELLRALNEEKTTEIIIQISDGAIYGDVAAYIEQLNRLRIHTLGMSIGGASARESLQRRHKHVIEADTVDGVVKNFTPVLMQLVDEMVAQPMIDHLEELAKSLDIENEPN